MSADEQNKAQATMRIDITPAMLEQLQQAPAPGGVRVPNRSGLNMAPRTTGPGVIRIPVAAPRPLGGEEFQLLLQSIYDAVFITNPKGDIVTANIRAEQFFLSTKAEFRKGNIFDWLFGASHSLLDTILSSLEGNRFVLLQALCRRTDETMFPAEISVSRLQLGGKLHLSFFIRDITLRKETEERLKTGYTALQNAGGGIAVADVEGLLAGYVNPAMLQLLGLDSPEAAYEHNFSQFLQSPDQASTLFAAAQAGDTWMGELDMKRADGTPFFAQVVLAPNLNPDGAMTGIVISLVDVTPQRQAQQQLTLYASQLRQKNAEMEADLRMARDLQYAFLPASYPDVASGPCEHPGRLDFAHVYHPSGLVGGDFFSLLQTADHQVLVFMADVMGHGARASLVVATIRGLLEQVARETRQPGIFMTRLNAAYSRIFNNTGDLMFATACCLLFDLKAGLILYANAGHPLPIVLEPGAPVHAATFSPDAMGPALGLFGDAIYGQHEGSLSPGTRVLFYTDGLTEARNSAQDEFEDEAFHSSLEAHRDKPLDAFLEALVADAQTFSGNEEFEDDVCVLGVDFRPV